MELVVGVISGFGPCAVLSKCPKQAKLQNKGECVCWKNTLCFKGELILSVAIFH